jgi:ABC-type transport system involved in cytochrome c biogenesis permease subunit
MSSTFWFNVCTIFYVAALFLYIGNLVSQRFTVRRWATVTVALGFLAQTVGLVIRWHEAGLVELEAAERATGLTLEGATRFVIYSQHPPWSNLYEIMVYMAWGVILVFLVAEVKWKIPLAGILSLLLALVSLGLASLTTDATIKPLVPALQSWWIMIHVISSAVGYAAGTLGAVASLLYLIKAKSRVSLAAVGSGMMVLTAFLYLILGRGLELFTTLSYRVKLLKEMGGDMISVGQMVGEDFKSYYVSSPGVGALLMLSVLASVAAAVILWRARKTQDSPTGLAKMAYFGALAISTATVGLIVINNLVNTDVQLPDEVASRLMPPGPWTLGFQSNQWDLALFLIVWGGQVFVALCLLKPEWFRQRLPDAKSLDRAAYYSIMVSFALVAVVLVTGALWAHYAWGRYWGWDPKETGALVIWIVYAIYLHARVTYGWVGAPSAVIGILGFFIILAGFLGVNLGWFAGGLHSYGSA